jgi:uncharacterized membrane protein YGL010W
MNEMCVSRYYLYNYKNVDHSGNNVQIMFIFIPVFELFSMGMIWIRVVRVLNDGKPEEGSGRSR